MPHDRLTLEVTQLDMCQYEIKRVKGAASSYGRPLLFTPFGFEAVRWREGCLAV
jgi:hypothetical protein